jgi:hypothetical protein
VSATVFYGVQLGAAAYDNHGYAVDFRAEGYRLADGLRAADVDPR